jgi:hypothetical protein
MVTLKITVEDEQAEALKQMLKHIDLIKTVEEEHLAVNQLNESSTPYERLKNIQKAIGNQELFKEIKDPSAWQREIRKEWDRDF